jgi:arginase
MIERIAVIGVPIDLGSNRRGVDMGPSALRVTGLPDRIRKLGYDVADLGDLKVPMPEACDPGDPSKRYAGDIAQVCSELSDRVEVAVIDDRMPLVLGGDHSLSIGSVSGMAKACRNREKPMGLIWFDAHGDMNTPDSTGTGNVHGMPLSHLLGLGDPELSSISGFRPKVLPRNVYIVGIRDLDPRERKLVADSGVNVLTMKDLDMKGVNGVMEPLLAALARDTSGAYVSLDLDVVDPGIAPGVGTPKRGGLTYREAHLCLEKVADSGLMIGMDLVEINPILDDGNITAELGT